MSFARFWLARHGEYMDAPLHGRAVFIDANAVVAIHPFTDIYLNPSERSAKSAVDAKNSTWIITHSRRFLVEGLLVEVLDKITTARRGIDGGSSKPGGVEE